MNNNQILDEVEDVLRVDLGAVDCKYGKVNVFCEIPFLGSSAKVKEDHEALMASPKLNQIVGEIVCSYRDLWPQYTDDEIFEKMQINLVASGLMFGCGDATDPRFRFICHLAAIGWALDDMGDGGEDDEEEQRKRKEEQAQDEATKWAKVKREYRMVVEVFRDQPVPTMDKFPNVSSKYAALREALDTFNRVAYETIPNFAEKYGMTYKDEMLCYLESVMLNRGLKASPDKVYRTRSAYHELLSYLGGQPLVIEVYGILYGVVVPEKIRKDLLFRMVFNRVVNVWGMINSFVGLEKDLREEQVDSPIFYEVLHRGKSLQEAVDDMCAETVANMNDYRTLRGQLLDVFDDEPSVAQFVHNCDTLINGQLYFFNLTDRYGVSHKLSITKPSEKTNANASA